MSEPCGDVQRRVPHVIHCIHVRTEFDKTTYNLNPARLSCVEQRSFIHNILGFNRRPLTHQLAHNVDVATQRSKMQRRVIVTVRGSHTRFE